MDKKTIILIIIIIAILIVFGILIKTAIQTKNDAEIYNSATKTTEPVIETMNSQEIKVFNSKFENYLGTQTGSKVKALISVVNYSNINNDEHDVNCNVDISDIDIAKTYFISAEYDNYGYISSIIIK